MEQYCQRMKTNNRQNYLNNECKFLTQGQNNQINLNTSCLSYFLIYLLDQEFYQLKFQIGSLQIFASRCSKQILIYNMLKIPFLNNPPNISLSQLQKQYLESQKKKHRYSSSTLLPKFSHEDIKIKSPFYKKICQKLNCKCQFHKKQKKPVPRFMHGTKKDFNRKSVQEQLLNQKQKNQNRASKSLNRNITLLKSIRESSQFMKQKRHKTLAQECQYQYQDIDMDDARQQYQEYLKEQKIKNKHHIDCYNLKFQQFLKTRYLCILQNFKKPSRKDLYKKNRMMFKKKYLSTQFKKDSNGEQDQNNTSLHNEDGGDILGQTNSTLKKNLGNRKSLMSRGSGFFSKSKGLQQILNSLKAQYFGMNNFNDQISQQKLLALICKNIMAGDENLKQQTKQFIRRLSQVPLNLFKTLFGQMRQQMKSGINIDIDIPNISEQNIQNIIKQVISQVQKNIEDLVKEKKQKKGQQKISILNKFRKQINSGMLLHPYSSPLQRQKTRRSKFLTNSIQFQNFDNIRLSEHSKKGENEVNLDNVDYQEAQKEQTAEQLDFNTQKDKQHLPQVRKAPKNIKKNNQKKIIQQIENQIQRSNQARKVFHGKTFVLPQQIAYQKRRAQSRQRLRDQESKNHRQFIQMMKKKQYQRQSSTLSQYQAHKNTIKSHFQKNKIFLKKIQMTLENSELKNVIINLQDNVLTKKRKMRLLNNMIQVQQIKETEFYYDIKKYIDIYQKNCMLVTKDKTKQKSNNSGRYTKRMLLSREKFFDYQVPDTSIKLSAEETQLMSLLRLDGQLKFYLINQINCKGQEDPDNYTIKIPQYTSQKAAVRKRQVYNWQRFREEQQSQECSQFDRNILGQTGLKNKFPQENIRIKNIQLNTQEQTITQSFQKGFKMKLLRNNMKPILEQKQLKQNQYIHRIEDRFNKKMKQYRRIFKTCGNE